VVLSGCRSPLPHLPVFDAGGEYSPAGPDHDLDGLTDSFENAVAERFRPVLHKHGHDLQKGLYNVDLLLDGRADLYVERRETILDFPASGPFPDGPRYFGRRANAPFPVVVTHRKKWRLSAAPDGRPADLRIAGVETGVHAIQRKEGPGIIYRPFRWTYDACRRIELNPDEWLIDIDDALTFDGHAGAPEGRRPVYFHLYPRTAGSISSIGISSR